MRKLLLVFSFIQSSCFASTHIDDRIATLSLFSQANLESQCQDVWKHFEKWHDEDYQDLYAAVQKDENKERLKKIYDFVVTQFSGQNMDFETLDFCYEIYSEILSYDLAPNEFLSDQDVGYLDKQFSKLSDWVLDPQKSEERVSRCGKVLYSGVVPFVSQNAVVDLRTLNKSFAIGMPIQGLPLVRQNFDFSENALPCVFYEHDAAHVSRVFIFEGSTTRAKNFLVNCNALIEKMSDKKMQVICDYVLYEAVHETKIYKLLSQPKTLEEIFLAYETNIYNDINSQPHNIDYNSPVRILEFKEICKGAGLDFTFETEDHQVDLAQVKAFYMHLFDVFKAEMADVFEENSSS